MPHPSPRVFALRWVAAAAIATVAVLRCVSFFAPQLVFDVDPGLDPLPLGGLGPAGSLWLDAVLLLACGAGLAGEALAGRRLEWSLLGLAAAPAAMVFVHGLSDAGDLWRGTTWTTAALAAVTAAHLARCRRLRALLQAMLLAVVAPLLARGAANVTWEHEENVAVYEARKAAILADKGWEEGSPYALIFERRLRQREPTGWFLTTNVFASFMVVGVVAGAGLAIAGAGAGVPSGWTGLMALLGVGAAGGLGLSGSKGAVLAAAAGLVLLVAPMAAPAAGWVLRRWGGPIALGAVAATLLAVAARGAVLPEGFAGDRSLLYRWHYTLSSRDILLEHPLAGVGPAGYQRAYMRHRVARNPEEVASAHSVFWDWLCGLGVSGAGWVALACTFLWRAGAVRSGAAAAEAERAEQTGAGMGSLPLVMTALAGAGLGPGLAVIFEIGRLDGPDLVVRGMGALAYLAVAVTALRLLARLDPARIRWAFSCAALAVLVHGQIEMSFTQPGAAVCLMCLLGVAGAGRQGGRERSGHPRRGGGQLVAGLLAIAAVAVAGGPAAAASRQAALMRRAARTVAAPFAGSAAPAAEVEVAARRQAAALLLEAHDEMPTNLLPMVDAADELERAARRVEGPAAIALLREAADISEASIAAGGYGQAEVIAIFSHRRLARLTGRVEDARAAIALQRAVVQADPNGLLPRVRLGDLLWAAGDHEAARSAYARALEIDENFALDPLKRLPRRRRKLLEQRLETR